MVASGIVFMRPLAASFMAVVMVVFVVVMATSEQSAVAIARSASRSQLAPRTQGDRDPMIRDGGVQYPDDRDGDDKEGSGSCDRIGKHGDLVAWRGESVCAGFDAKFDRAWRGNEGGYRG